MEMSTSIDIDAPPTTVWNIITDIAYSADIIQGIHKVEVLEPAKGPSIVGLKWKEWRTFGGREATEIMWITEAEEPSHYVARAESHGSIYNSTMAIKPEGDGSTLTMTFEGTPQTLGARIMWALTGWMAKGAVRKACAADLADIKTAAEGA